MSADDQIRALLAEAADLWRQEHGSPGSYSLADAGFAMLAESVLWDICGPPVDLGPPPPPPRKRSRIPSAVRCAVYDRDGWRCVVCGSSDDLTLDHVHPYSLGGSDTAENLQAMCRPCNSRKGAKV